MRSARRGWVGWGPSEQQGSVSPRGPAPPQVLAASLLCPPACASAAVSLLSLGRLLTGPPSPPLASQRLAGWGGDLSSGSIKTSWLTHSHGQWCLGKDLRGSSCDCPRPSPVGPDTATHSQELDPKRGLLRALPLTPFHILWALAARLGPHPGSDLTTASYPSFPVPLLSVLCRILTAPSDPAAFWSASGRDQTFWGC